MKHFYYVITVEKDKKYFSYHMIVTENDNLKTLFETIENAISIFPVATEKQALEIMIKYNERFKEDGNYLY